MQMASWSSSFTAAGSRTFSRWKRRPSACSLTARTATGSGSTSERRSTWKYGIAAKACPFQLGVELSNDRAPGSSRRSWACS
jgi:hypothetical protein